MTESDCASDLQGPSESDAALSGISVRNLTVRFQSAAVLDGLELEVKPGEIVALLGASGCGKSTLLRSIARLIVPSDGEIVFSGNGLAIGEGALSYVFQDATLLPWRTVFENVLLPFELGAESQRVGGGASAAFMRTSNDLEGLAKSALLAVGMDSSSFEKFPRELSGGMRMRTSIARALVTDPGVMLLDEPFAALDDLLRTRMNDLILKLWEKRRRTVVFVTHNIAEAVYLSHRVAILGGGKIAKLITNPLRWPRVASQRSAVEFAQFYGQVSASLAEAAA